MLIEIVKDGASVKQLRSEPRMKVLLTGEMSSRRGAFACRIVDISRGGACLDTDRAHEVGENVSVRRGSLQAGGTVMWSRGKRFGVRFDQPIRATELLVQMSQSRAVGAATATATPATQRPRELSLSVHPSPSR